MKSIKLVISAFGPYKGCVEIDFTKFYDKIQTNILIKSVFFSIIIVI